MNMPATSEKNTVFQILMSCRIARWTNVASSIIIESRFISYVARLKNMPKAIYKFFPYYQLHMQELLLMQNILIQKGAKRT